MLPHIAHNSKVLWCFSHESQVWHRKIQGYAQNPTAGKTNRVQTQIWVCLTLPFKLLTCIKPISICNFQTTFPNSLNVPQADPRFFAAEIE